MLFFLRGIHSGRYGQDGLPTIDYNLDMFTLVLATLPTKMNTFIYNEASFYKFIYNEAFYKFIYNEASL